jgi:phosphatidate cytidylyltransferase
LLKWRLTIGAVLALVLAGGCWLETRHPGAFLGPCALLLAWLGAGEMLRMAHAVGRRPAPLACRAATLLPACGALVPLYWADADAQEAPLRPLAGVLAGLLAGLATSFAVEMRRVQGQGRSLGDLAVATLSVTYVGGLLGVLVALRQLGPPSAGLASVLALVLIVKSSDIGQYACGRLWGKRKLAPRLSPGKTWEGFAGGLAAAALASCGVSRWLAPAEAASNAATLCLCGVLLAAAGVFGDLAESLLKREAGLKDSSDWLPGYGGVLDLLDSLLFAAPAAWLLVACGWLRFA